jgi:hypothetical protein
VRLNPKPDRFFAARERFSSPRPSINHRIHNYVVYVGIIFCGKLTLPWANEVGIDRKHPRKSSNKRAFLIKKAPYWAKKRAKTAVYSY